MSRFDVDHKSKTQVLDDIASTLDAMSPGGNWDACRASAEQRAQLMAMENAGLPATPARSWALRKRIAAAIAYGAGVGERLAQLHRVFPEGGMSLHDAAAQFLAAWGIRDLSGFPALKAALDPEREIVNRRNVLPRIALAAGLSEFGNILSDVAHLVFVNSYKGAPPTWIEWCLEDQSATRLEEVVTTLEPFGSLGEEAEGAEVRNFDNQAKDLGVSAVLRVFRAVFRVGEKALRNDTTKALTERSSRAGVAASSTEDDVVYELLTSNAGLGPKMADGHFLFDSANHGNIGTPAVISAASINEARTLLAAQTNTHGDKLHLRPKNLLVPVAQVNTAAAELEKMGNAQLPERDRLRIVSESRLDEVSDTAWCLAAAPEQAPVIQVLFMRGKREPDVLTQWYDFMSEMRTRVRHIVGCVALDYRGIVRNAGA